jgi:hypothetical protein
MRAAAVLALAMLTSCAPVTGGDSVALAPAGFALPPMRAFPAAPAPLPLRPNAEIAADFLDLAFMLESGREIAAFTRFEGPVPVRVAGDLPATLVPDLRALLARLNGEAGIDVYLSAGPEAALSSTHGRVVSAPSAS